MGKESVLHNFFVEIIKAHFIGWFLLLLLNKHKSNILIIINNHTRIKFVQYKTQLLLLNYSLSYLIKKLVTDLIRSYYTLIHQYMFTVIIQNYEIT